MSTLKTTLVLPAPALPSCPKIRGDRDPALARFGALLE